MKPYILAFILFAALLLAACGSDEPQWVDPEAHEKTEQLRAQYAPYLVGTWHYEKTVEKQRAYEQLTFLSDGSLRGTRKWQTRQLVTIDGRQQYTDWEDMPDENGSFTGTWMLVWERNGSGVGENRIILHASWDDQNNPIIAYNTDELFGYADATALQFAGNWRNSDGWTIYQRGEAAPGF